jgi:hypothetical protein
MLEKDGEAHLERSCKKKKEVLQRVKEERNISHKVQRKNANWIGHSLRKNCLLKHVIEFKKIEGTGRRGRRRKQLLDDFKGRKGHWKLKEEALDRTL